jgi:hypothetical protein
MDSDVLNSKATENGKAPGAIEQLDLLSRDECTRVHTTLETLRPHWIKRHAVAPFYTLGASNYFDIAYNPDLPYYRLAGRLNPLLREHFGWLYDRLLGALAVRLDAPAGFTANLAVPGFHLVFPHESLVRCQDLTHAAWFRHREDPHMIGNPIHCDTPYQVVDWGGEPVVDFNRVFSFTLAITMPRENGGLNVWELSMNETAHASEADLLALFRSRRKTFHPYRIGSLALHSGTQYHQVASIAQMQADESRITLQGHGVFCDSRWVLYW